MGEGIAVVFVIAIAGLLAWFMIKIPISIAQSRNVKRATVDSIRLLSILGLIFGITWIIALCWACMAAPEEYDQLGNPDLTGETAAVATAETCDNCGYTIGKLETPHVWQGHVVCADCSKRL